MQWREKNRTATKQTNFKNNTTETKSKCSIVRRESLKLQNQWEENHQREEVTQGTPHKNYSNLMLKTMLYFYILTLSTSTTTTRLLHCLQICSLGNLFSYSMWADVLTLHKFVCCGASNMLHVLAIEQWFSNRGNSTPGATWRYSRGYLIYF